MFREVLRGIGDRVEGTLAVSLIGLDGIAVETVSYDSVPLEAMGAEFGGFIKSVRSPTRSSIREKCSSFPW